MMQRRALLTTISSTCVEAPSASSSGVSYPSHHQPPPFSSGTKSTPVPTKKSTPSSSPRPTGKPNKPTNSTKSGKVKSKTIRIEIPVHMPTKQSFCEFVYDDLLKKHSQSLASDDPFNDPNEDEDVKRIARQMEEKYGGGSGKRSAWQDYLERGSGYDETDPFVDNTEAYDELIPHEMTTKHGGFYINSGQLEFKPVDRDEESIERPPPIASGIKRRKSFNGASMPVPGRKKKKDLTDQVRPLELRAPSESPKTLNLVMDKEHSTTKQQSTKQPVNEELKQHSKNAPLQNAQMQPSKQQQQITQQSSKQHPHSPLVLQQQSAKPQQAQQSSKQHASSLQKRQMHSQVASQSTKNLPVSQQQRQPSSSSSSSTNHHSQNSLANPRIQNPAVPQPQHPPQQHQPQQHQPQSSKQQPKAAHQQHQPLPQHLQQMYSPIDAIIMEQIRLRTLWPQMNMFNRFIQDQMHVTNATPTSRPSSSNATPVIVSNNSAPRPTPPPPRASSVKPTGNCSTSGPG